MKINDETLKMLLDKISDLNVRMMTIENKLNILQAKVFSGPVTASPATGITHCAERFGSSELPFAGFPNHKDIL